MFRQMARGRTRPAVTICSSQRILRVPRKRIDELVAHVAAAERTRLAEVDVAVVGAEEMAALNRRHLGREGATDALSFDLSESPASPLIAQLVVCADAAVREARGRGLPPQHELMLYVIHGLLHLMGYDDGDARSAARMHAREEELLAAFLSRRTTRRPRRKASR
jgi:probable rRNA maturation factor